MSDDRKLAMFIDFENIVRGVKEAQYKAFEIRLVLERLVEKGKIMVKRAYADWNRYAEYKRPFHEHAIELIDVPQSRYSGKNSADIRMVVDAMDLAYSKHVDSSPSSRATRLPPVVSSCVRNAYVIGSALSPRRPSSSSSSRRFSSLETHPRVEEDHAPAACPKRRPRPSPSSSTPAGAPARNKDTCGARWSSRHDPETPPSTILLRLSTFSKLL